MMREILESEAKGCWPELLAAVEQGETVAIMRDGRPVAHLTPAAEPTLTTRQWGKIPEDYETRRQQVEEFRRRRAEWGPISVTLEELLEWRSCRCSDT